eukprot:Gb_17182 [translate_table: standard]
MEKRVGAFSLVALLVLLVLSSEMGGSAVHALQYCRVRKSYTYTRYCVVASDCGDACSKEGFPFGNCATINFDRSCC